MRKEGCDLRSDLGQMVVLPMVAPPVAAFSPLEEGGGGILLKRFHGRRLGKLFSKKIEA